MEHLPSAQRPMSSMAAGQKFFFGPHRLALSVGECAALRDETLVAASAQDPTARNANEQMSRGTRTTATAYRTAGWPAMVFRRPLLGSQGVPAAGRERSLDPARLAANRNFQLLQLDERCLASADAQARDIMAMPPRQRSRFRAGWGIDFGRGERNSELGYSETNSAAHPDTIRGGGQEGDFEYHVALVDKPTGHPPPPRRPQGSRSSCQDSSCTCSYKNESSLL